MLSLAQRSSALTYAVCRAQYTKAPLPRHQNTYEHHKVPMAIVGNEYRIHVDSNNAQNKFDMTINLDEVSFDTDNDPFDCDPSEEKFYLPSTAITCSAGPLTGVLFVGYLNLRSRMIHVNAVDTDEYNWFWLTITQH